MGVYPVSLIWPGDQPDPICVVLGQFKRLADGRIAATYESQEQLGETLAVMLSVERAALEERLEHGLAMMTGCTSEKKWPRLMGRWKELIDRHQRVLGWECAVREVIGEREGLENTVVAGIT